MDKLKSLHEKIIKPCEKVRGKVKMFSRDVVDEMKWL